MTGRTCRWIATDAVVRACGLALAVLGCGPSTGETMDTPGETRSTADTTFADGADTTFADGADTTSADGADATSTGGSDVSTACDDPTPVSQADGQPSGYERCADGFVHRSTAVACTLPAGGTCQQVSGTCSQDDECTDAPMGACISTFFEGCHCVYGCQDDDDCGPDEVCACAGLVGPWPQCIPAECKTDADCGDGLCGLDAKFHDCGDLEHAALACLNEASECRQSASCTATENDCYRCGIAAGEWTCADAPCFSDCG